MRILFAGLLAMVILAQCGPATSSSEKENTEAPAAKGVPPITILTFICQTLMDENEQPSSQVFLQINQERVKIADIAACDVINGDRFADYGIPSAAVAACGGWWAGAGDYFYAVRDGDHIKVMKGWQDEGQEDVGFHYELATDIDLTTLFK